MPIAAWTDEKLEQAEVGSNGGFGSYQWEMVVMSVLASRRLGQWQVGLIGGGSNGGFGQ